jgi:hypothetical protein
MYTLMRLPRDDFDYKYVYFILCKGAFYFLGTYQVGGKLRKDFLLVQMMSLERAIT